MMSDPAWHATRDDIAKYYARLVDRYGNDPRAADYGRAESQAKKFQVLSEVARLSGAEVLDVGCGLAGFSDFLKSRWGDVDYRGIDVTPAMIDLASKLHPELKLEVGDVLEIEGSELYDVVFANGIFYLIKDQPTQRMQAIVRRMFALARKAVAFNSLSIWAPCSEAGEFQADPIATVQFCRELTSRVALRHDYMPHDFTIYLYKPL